ncbi:peroxiredoxin [Ectothiorhodospira variabilis]|uniref:peroxiredoxin n=1 Tax=Ectothiorhodospira variabilis TaxID=505694 RepID=UPI001EFAFC1F|nr:peroxiredoxin [Ectothiorhodospira variabilis]MCG5493636.1 peroxiredoxin [Ectothiorhodospira variabilis]MCG5502965.1 peroxiredoxin [Ectothiorhodospira variabilis]MCG5506247.1 peroxiredoxin [Ectothiorhodospira variabilis]
MTIQTGEPIPEVTLRIMTPAGDQPISTSELFTGFRVALFAVPGAFTPACSGIHLPGFIARHDRLKAAGIERVMCVAVNDIFVLNAWGEIHEVGNRILMVADGNADFTRAVGLDVDASGSGMGTRSRRYAMIVDNGHVEWLGVDKPRQVVESSADAVLEALGAKGET